MSEQWIRQMQQKMADYKRPAHEVSWDEIDQALAAGKTHKTRQLWLQRVAAAAAILLIDATVWGFFSVSVCLNPQYPAPAISRIAAAAAMRRSQS